MKNLVITFFAFCLVLGIKAQNSDFEDYTFIDLEPDTIDADTVKMEIDIINVDESKPNEVNLSEYKLDDNLNYPKIKTSLGNLYVVPDYHNTYEEAKESTYESHDSYAIYLIKDSMITKTLMLKKPIKVKDHLIVYLEFDNPNTVTKNIQTNDEFVLTCFGNSVESLDNKQINVLYNERLDALAKKEKFTRADLDQLDIVPIATPDGKIFFNGVYGLWVCRKISELPSETGSILMIAEVVDILLLDKSK